MVRKLFVGVYLLLFSIPLAVGEPRTRLYCLSFRYGSCPAFCTQSCVSSSCNGAGPCTADCGGEGSCRYEGKAEREFDINLPGADGRTPIMNLAVTHTDIETFQSILSMGADINARSSDGKSALLLLQKKKTTIPAIEFFLKNGADLRAVDDAGQGVVLTTQCPDREIYEFWVAKGLDLTVRDKSGLTPVHACLPFRNREVAGYLLDHGVSAKAMGPLGSYLHYALLTGDAEWVPFLVKRGVERSAKDRNGDTVLQAALKYQVPAYCDFARQLIKSGFKVGSRERAIAKEKGTVDCLISSSR